MDKLEIIKQTRKIAAETLLIVLKEVLQKDNKISEAEFVSRWLEQLRKYPEIFPNGWYEPPPFGIGVLITDSNNPQRISYDNLRLEKNWPQENVFLDKKNGLAYLFASPVNKQAGIIGDFGITIYFGNKDPIINHLKKCLKINKEIFKFANIGMSLAEVFEYAEELFSQNGLSNQVLSFTDPSKFNFGHTIPSTDIEWSDEETKIVKSEDWNKIKDLISRRRIFVNRVEQFKIIPGVAFTIEPRLKVLDNPNLPISLSFHTIGTFNKDGSKELLTGFNQIFKLVRMDYMLNKI